MKNITRKAPVHLGQADVSPSLFIYRRACFTLYASKTFCRRRSRLFAAIMRNDGKQVISVVFSRAVVNSIAL